VGKTDDSVGLYNFAAGGWESLILRHQYQKQISSLCVRALILERIWLASQQRSW